MNRGDVWYVNLDPTLGSETKKTRPAIVVSADHVGRLPLRVIVPLTDWNNSYYHCTWMVFVANDSDNGLTKISAADCLNIRAVSTERFVRKIGEIRADTMEDILAALAIVLAIPH